MSYPKCGCYIAEIVQPGQSVSARVFGWHHKERILWVEVDRGMQGDPPWRVFSRHEVKIDDVRWVNTEAADAFNLHGHGFKVLGIGYQGHEKQRAYEDEHGG
jgi:hypothetical protein